MTAHTSRHDQPHRPPRECPVCSAQLAITRLGCRTCGTELSGDFVLSPFAALSTEDQEMLRVFLVSRGNMRELERHLGVSYPTARQRYAELLGRLGLEGAGSEPPLDRDKVLAELAAGRISVDEAEEALRALGLA
jgi:hypothetical protein